MKRIIALLIVLSPLTALAADPMYFGYHCMADEGKVLENAVCAKLGSGFAAQEGVLGKLPGNTRWYALIVIPYQHPDGKSVSAAVVVNYVDRRCGELMLSTHIAVIVHSEDQMEQERFTNYAKDVVDSTRRWEAKMLPEVQRVCHGGGLMASLEVER